MPETRVLSERDQLAMTAEKPRCKLIGTNGNVYALAARVRRALLRAGQEAQATAMLERWRRCQSYAESLELFAEYVEIH